MTFIKLRHNKNKRQWDAKRPAEEAAREWGSDLVGTELIVARQPLPWLKLVVLSTGVTQS